MNNWSCYCLVHPKGNTYIGATVDLNHRLRQHNRELVGGAKATTRLVTDSLKWSRICSVSGFPNQTAALQFEWRWKRLSYRGQKSYSSLKPVERRLVALHTLLHLDRPTSKALPYNSYQNGNPVVHWEPDQLSNKMRYYTLNPVKIKLRTKR